MDAGRRVLFFASVLFAAASALALFGGGALYGAALLR
jgi:hypothetical protein